jgi:alpha-tubulin suppressor-like RCC1 family protein
MKTRTIYYLVGISIICLLTFSCGSLGSGGDGGSDEDTSTHLSVDAPSMLVMVAGDSLTVEVDTVTNNPRGRELPRSMSYAISLAPRYETVAAGGTPAFGDYSFDYSVSSSERPRLAELTINTLSDVAPGIYEHEISMATTLPATFTENPPAILKVVILPTSGVTKTRSVTKVSAGLGHSLALLDDGTVWAWGGNRFGQLGDTTLVDRSIPVQVYGFSGPVRDIAAGDNHSVALQENGRVYTWGANDRRQLGVSHTWVVTPGCPNGRPDSDHREETYTRAREIITRLSAAGCDYNPVILENVVGIAAGDEHSLAFRSDDSVVAWGRNHHGQLGDDGTGRSVEFVKNVLYLPPSRPVALAAGGAFSLALLLDGRVLGWGENGIGQLGTNPRRDIMRAADVPFTGEVQLVRAGEDFVLARRRGEPGYLAWGGNSFGQLGNGTRDSTDLPRLINKHLVLMQLAAGYRHSVGTLPNGEVYTWGDNMSEQMAGQTASPMQLSPLQVPGLSGMSGLAAGGFHTLTRHNTCGNVFSWGRNVSGQLGQVEISSSRAQPLPVYGLAENDIGAGCRLALRVWQRGRGTITSQPSAFGDTGCTGHCGASFEEGSIVELTASPAEGHEFIEWKGDCSGTVPSVSVTLDESKNCLAVYRPTPGFDAPPEASFTISATDAIVDQLVGFDAGASSDDGQIVSYEWDFEDDGQFDEIGPVVSHVFPAAGGYTIRLRVTDDAGQQAEATRELVVGPVLAAPQNAQASAGDAQVIVSWDSVVDAASYNLYWNNTGSVSTADTAINGVTSPYDHTPLTNGTPYYYIVTAVGASGEGAPSSEVSATPTAGSVVFELEVQAYEYGGASGSVTSSPAGIDCNTPNTCARDFANGTLVRLTAYPVAPNTFDSWGGTDSGDCTTGIDGSGNNYCEITIFQDMAIMAIFGPPGPF